MNWRDCFKALGVAVVGGVLAGVSFSLIPSKLVAGAVAGVGFLLVGGYCLRISLRAQRPWLWVTLYTSLFHLFGISIPMIVVRWMDPSVPFAQMKVWGLPGHIFHFHATNFYYTLMLGLVLDGVRAWLQERSKNKSQSVVTG